MECYLHARQGHSYTFEPFILGCHRVPSCREEQETASSSAALQKAHGHGRASPGSWPQNGKAGGPSANSGNQVRLCRPEDSCRDESLFSPAF